MELIISPDDRNFEYSARQERKIGLFKGYKKVIESIAERKKILKNTRPENKMYAKLLICTILWA